MKMTIHLTEDDIKQACIALIEKKLEVSLSASQSSLLIEVKSKQNYKSEWERAAFKGTFTYDSETTGIKLI